MIGAEWGVRTRWAIHLDRRLVIAAPREQADVISHGNIDASVWESPGLAEAYKAAEPTLHAAELVVQNEITFDLPFGVDVTDEQVRAAADVLMRWS